MARPATKAQLEEAAAKNFEKLTALVDSMSPAQQQTDQPRISKVRGMQRLNALL